MKYDDDCISSDISNFSFKRPIVLSGDPSKGLVFISFNARPAYIYNENCIVIANYELSTIIDFTKEEDKDVDADGAFLIMSRSDSCVYESAITNSSCEGLMSLDNTIEISEFVYLLCPNKDMDFRGFGEGDYKFLFAYRAPHKYDDIKSYAEQARISVDFLKETAYRNFSFVIHGAGYEELNCFKHSDTFPCKNDNLYGSTAFYKNPAIVEGCNFKKCDKERIKFHLEQDHIDEEGLERMNIRM